jgi:hypothetical protein
MVRHDYDLEPARPVVMAEGAYEAGEEYGFEVGPPWVRRQAYWTVLSGGYHTYGHNDLWRLRPGWREALDAPGAAQLTILRDVLTARREWWNLVPDQSLVVGPGDPGPRDPNLTVAARSRSGDWALVYVGGGSTVSLDLSKLGAPAAPTASWIDPVTGEPNEIGTVAAAGVERLPLPAGWEDALLLLERR